MSSSTHTPTPVPVRLVIVLVALVLGAFFCGIGQPPHVSRERDNGPFLQIVGHYVPQAVLASGTPVTVGSGETAELRLTEGEVAPTLARADVDVAAGTVRIIHDATDRDAAYYRVTEGWGSAHTLPGALLPMRAHERVVWTEGDDDNVSLAEACASKASQAAADPSWEAADLSLVDATGTWLMLSDGERHIAVLPDVPGASIETPLGTLRFDGSTLGIQAPGDAKPSPVRRFTKPDAFLAVNAEPPAPIPTTGSSAPLGKAWHVFHRRPRAESATPWLWSGFDVLAALRLSDGPEPPRIARAPGFSGRLFKCGSPIHEIGATDLRNGDLFVVGRTTFSIEARTDRPFGLNAAEPAERTHALASLSDGCLRSPNARWPVPPCESKAGHELLRVRARVEPQSGGSTGGVEPSVALPGESTAWVPLPAWANEAATEGAPRSPAIDLLEVCATDQGALRVLRGPPSTAVPLIERPSTEIADGGTIGVAGHWLQYARREPLTERRLPLLGFFVWIAVFGARALRRVTALLPPTVSLFDRVVPAAAIGAFVTLLGVGAFLQTHLAVSDRLLASPDYLQRHLITSALAVAALDLAIELCRRDSSESLLAPALERCGWVLAALTAWMALDAVATSAFVGRLPARIEGDVLRTAALFACASGAMWLVGFQLSRRGPWIHERVRAFLRPLEALSEGDAHERGVRAFFRAALRAPAREARPLLHGAFLLGAGLIVGGSGRGLLGFDLKLAEFASLPIGLGLAGLLVVWAQTGSSWGRYAVPASTVLWLGITTAIAVLGYALRGDLGPLMVLTPATVGSVALWVVPSRRTSVGDLGTRDRLTVLIAYLVLIACASGLALSLVPRVESWLTEIPGIGSHVERAVERFHTHFAPWYTVGGHWATTAIWIASGLFDREHFVSNLHSDLAFVAVIQSFGGTRALFVLFLFLALCSTMALSSERALGRAERARSKALAALASDDVSADERRRIARDVLPTLRAMSTAGTFGLFAALCLGFEVLIHVGTCFNTLPQTGLTLPWVSAGGSASIGFALLLGTALGRLVAANNGFERVRAQK